MTEGATKTIRKKSAATKKAAASSDADDADHTVAVKKQKISPTESVVTSSQKQPRVEGVRKFLKFDVAAFLVKVLKDHFPAITGGRWAFGGKYFKIDAPADKFPDMLGKHTISRLPMKMIKNANRESEHPLLLKGNIERLLIVTLKQHLESILAVSKRLQFWNGCVIRVGEGSSIPLSGSLLGIDFELTDMDKSMKGKKSSKTKRRERRRVRLSRQTKAGKEAVKVAQKKKEETKNEKMVQKKLVKRIGEYSRKFLKFDAVSFLTKVLQKAVPSITGGHWVQGLKLFLLSVPRDKIDEAVGTYLVAGHEIVIREDKHHRNRDFPLAAFGNLPEVLASAIKKAIPGKYGLPKEWLFRRGCFVRMPRRFVSSFKPVQKLGVTFELEDQLPINEGK
eukprot:NODE_1590_length_1481_cov_24.414804_g1434_i0.p1 GENE.NODE_1590_length_1481_cov_24.414804_g1434_i0~~NODE_1590_length_1481_cov_24.414804_g1434_i0.p1  ORF type:complete len:393 (-),score=90.80 NODE_1590_length_1481_cov_24.414804_g1434_i0:161-1339(-)